MEKWDAYTGNLEKIEGVTLVRGDPVPAGMYAAGLPKGQVAPHHISINPAVPIAECHLRPVAVLCHDANCRPGVILALGAAALVRPFPQVQAVSWIRIHHHGIIAGIHLRRSLFQTVGQGVPVDLRDVVPRMISVEGRLCGHH